MFADSSDAVQLDRLRLQNLLLSATIPGFLAFISLGLYEIVDDAAVAWRLSSGFAAIMYTALAVAILRSMMKLPDSQRAKMNLVMFPVIIGTHVINVIVQTMAASGLLGVDAFSVFYFGLIAVLALGVYQFVRAVLENVLSRARPS